MQAAEALALQGVQAEVIDLRTIKPLETGTVLRSVRKTGRLIVVAEASGLCGVAAQVAALAGQRAFNALKAPVLRLTGPDAPAAASWPLEQAAVPQANAVCQAALQLLGAVVAM